MNKLQLISCFIFLSLACASEFDFNCSESSYLLEEINAINDEKVNPSLYIFPVLKHDICKDCFNLLKNNNEIRITPILGVRYGSGGFEVFESIPKSDLLWVTPGIEFNLTYPILISFFDTGISLQAWARFNKHSAYGFDGNSPDKELILFEYNPYYSFEFYTNSQAPDNGIDFDEGEAAIALNSKWVDIVFGKFRSSIGPFLGGNLSISNKAPGFPQIQLRTKSDKINFTFIVGELYSGLLYDIETEGIKRSRYIVNHRIDYKVKDNLRIGLYEQIIVGDNLSLLYMVPLMPFWSAQHSLGDTDNLQMGFDVEYFKKNNRFYMALIADEWAPYDTFNENHHNWFGTQFGYSRIFSNNSLIKFEYTRIEPQVYTHDISINEPFHYNYPIGFWSKGDSEDFLFKAYFKLKNMKDFELSLRHTNMGNPNYAIDLDFLNGELKTRSVGSFKLRKIINSNLGAINCVLKVSQVDTKNLYDDESFTDCQISLLYNINY